MNEDFLPILEEWDLPDDISFDTDYTSIAIEEDV